MAAPKLLPEVEKFLASGPLQGVVGGKDVAGSAGETMKTLDRRITGSTTVPDNPTEREKKTLAAEKKRGQAESIAPVVPRKEIDRSK